jgi:hypothetical protein
MLEDHGAVAVEDFDALGDAVGDGLPGYSLRQREIADPSFRRLGRA